MTLPAADASDLCTRTLGQLPALRRLVHTDVSAAYHGDPAARSTEEIIVAEQTPGGLTERAVLDCALPELPGLGKPKAFVF